MKKEAQKFWKRKSEIIEWSKKPKKILSKKKIWYPDGKLNIYHNCIESKIQKYGNKTAIHTIDNNQNINKYSYNQVFDLVENFSHILKKNTNNKSIIAIHASASIESATAMFASCKLANTFSVIFEDLPGEAILTRLKILKPNIFITRASNKNIKKIIIPLIKKYEKITKKKIKIIKFSNEAKVSKLINVSSYKLLNKSYVKDKVKTINSQSNKSSFVLFTSGSTGQPKGIIHSTGGYILYSKYTCSEQFGINDKSIVMTASDAGWINGHTYSLFGPLSLGATTILLESPMLILNPSILKKLIYDYKITVLYLPVTIIRILKSLINNNFLKKNYLKSIGSMGEPLAANVGNWFSKKFSNNKIAVVNTFFQTETGGIICSPKYDQKNYSKLSGTVGKPINKHIKLFLEREKNKTYGKNEKDIKIKTLWPGCMKGVINGKSFFDMYWDKNSNFRLFDVGNFDVNNNLVVYGRSDDVINVRGHRIGSGEIESIIVKINEIKEACAVSYNDKIEGSKIIIFITLIKGQYFDEEIIKKKMVNHFGSYAIPKKIILLSQLPKTRSGKILRRVLRLLADNPHLEDIGDISTMLNKNLISEIKKKIIIKLNK